MNLYTIKIIDTARVEHYDSATWFLEVSIEVCRDGEPLHVRKIGLPDGSTESEILGTLRALKDDYAARDAREAEIANVEAKTNSALIGTEL